MKKIAKSAFLVAMVVCAVAVGRMVNKGFCCGFPDAIVGVGNAYAVVQPSTSEVAGMAWCYHYSKNAKYAAAQDAARTRRIGLWAVPNVQAPWAYRKSIKPQGDAQQVARQAQTGAGSTQVMDGHFTGSRVEYRAGNAM